MENPFLSEPAACSYSWRVTKGEGSRDEFIVSLQVLDFGSMDVEIERASNRYVVSCFLPFLQREENMEKSFRESKRWLGDLR